MGEGGAGTHHPQARPVALGGGTWAKVRRPTRVVACRLLVHILCVDQDGAAANLCGKLPLSAASDASHPRDLEWLATEPLSMVGGQPGDIGVRPVIRRHR